MNQPLSLHVDAEALRPLVRVIVAEAVAEVEADRTKVDPARLAYSEAEAAALLGLAPHVLRDERRRGRIAFSKIVGGRIAYARSDLVAYLAARRIEADTRAAA